MVIQRSVETFDAYLIDDFVVYHEFDERGNHRIRIKGKKKPGDWTWYQGIARYKDYAATTEYYMGILPRIFRLIEAKKTL